MDWKALLAAVAVRLREPSTYAGLAVVVGAVTHVAVADADVKNYSDIGTGIAGALAIVLREKGVKPVA